MATQDRVMMMTPAGQPRNTIALGRPVKGNNSQCTYQKTGEIIDRRFNAFMRLSTIARLLKEDHTIRT